MRTRTLCITLGLSALLLTDAVAQAPPDSSASEAAKPSLEERIKQLEVEVKELRAKQVEPPSAAPPSIPAEKPTASDEPFAWGDFSWINGGSRQTTKLIDSKYFTPQLDIDSNYTYSFNRPIDNTIVGSTAT